MLPDPSISHATPRARIVIVEDSRTQAAMLDQLLQHNGYEVFLALDGRRALELVAQQQPDIVISDIVMPEMDGYALCQALKEDAVVAQTPVILLSALNDAADIVRGLQAGADYYLTKPFSAPYLLSTLENVLARPDSPSGHEDALEVEVEGERYLIRSGRQQMLNLLLSTYGSAVEQNHELLKTQRALQTVNEKLIAQTQQIEAQQRELRQINAHLHHQATRDALTGLRNRRALMERLPEELDRARRRFEPLTFLLLDVDAFKSFNDTFGHAAGDEVLREVAARLENHARLSDFAARYGGEEFALLLPNTEPAVALHVAERLRETICAMPWPLRPITVSIGLATFLSDKAKTDDLTQLFARADTALYGSKNAGRNRSTHFDDLKL